MSNLPRHEAIDLATQVRAACVRDIAPELLNSTVAHFVVSTLRSDISEAELTQVLDQTPTEPR